MLRKTMYPKQSSRKQSEQTEPTYDSHVNKYVEGMLKYSYLKACETLAGVPWLVLV